MQVATHSFEEHGGELKLRVVAPTPGELFEHAGRVLADLMSGEALGRTLDVTQHVVLASPDREGLLVDWLNEVILRSEVGHVLFSRFVVDRLTIVSSRRR